MVITIAGVGTLQPASGTDYVIFENLPIGDYTVSESQLPDYHQVSTTCNNVAVNPGQMATCQFHNAHDQGDLTIHKEVDVDGDGNIDLHDPAGWTWDLDGQNTNYPMGSTQTVLTGIHQVQEDQQAGYHSAGWYCNNGQSGDGENLEVNVTTENVSCTFTNVRDTGSLKVYKYVDSGEADPDQWSFTINGIGTLQPASGSNYVIFEDIPTDSYTVTESHLADYHQVSTTCNNVMVAPGQTAECEFHNAHDEGQIIIHKEVDLDGDGDIDEYDPAGWTWDLDGGNQNFAMGSTQTVLTGTYTVSEDQHPGYHVVGWSCNDGTSGVGESFTTDIPSNRCHRECTFTNARDTGSLIVYKEVESGEATPDQWSFTIEGIGTLQPAPGNDYVVFENLLTGTYTVTESDIDGYHQVSTTCNNVEVSYDSQASCQFVNAHDTAYLRVEKEVDVDGDGDIDLVHPATEGWTTWQLDGGEVYPMGHTEQVLTGWHHVEEEQKPGYHVVSWYCCNGTSGDTEYLDVEITDDIVCTFTNARDVGSIEGYKFNDLDGDGAWEDGEPAIADFPIYLSNGWETQTDANGYYRFDYVPTGHYTVYEQVPTGWNNTTPVTVQVNVERDQTAYAEFGNFELIDITICKYVDLNGDGDITEDSLYLKEGGWPVSMGGIVEQTIEGCYTFTDIRYGTYDNEELPVAGWAQTYPAQGSYSHQAISGQDVTYDFGNFQLGEISGYKWEDKNGDGIWDEGEPVLNNW